MGNICSKSSNETDAFSQPGRVLGASSQQSSATPSAATPKKISATTPGRTLGGQSSARAEEDNARSAAARAAEVSCLILEPKNRTGPSSP